MQTTPETQAQKHIDKNIARYQREQKATLTPHFIKRFEGKFYALGERAKFLSTLKIKEVKEI